MGERSVAMTTHVLRVLSALCMLGLALGAPTKAGTARAGTMADLGSLSERDINTIMLYFAERVPYIISSATGNQQEDEVTEPLSKRFGIAGLDNVDMITSTLDRVRQQQGSRPGRRPLMSMRFSMDSLRRMLDAGR